MVVKPFGILLSTWLIHEFASAAAQSQCMSISDCYSKIRTRSPLNGASIGVDMCECYAASNLVSFDECEGSEGSQCPIAGCPKDACDGMEPHCIAGKCMFFAESLDKVSNDEKQVEDDEDSEAAGSDIEENDVGGTNSDDADAEVNVEIKPEVSTEIKPIDLGMAARSIEDDSSGSSIGKTAIPVILSLVVLALSI